MKCKENIRFKMQYHESRNSTTCTQYKYTVFVHVFFKYRAKMHNTQKHKPS